MARSAPLLLAALVGLAVAATAQNPPGDGPDLIAADLRLDKGDLVLEVQNQGPGSFAKGATTKATVSAVVKGKRQETEVEVPVPAEPFAVAEVRIPVKGLGVTDAKDLTSPVRVQLDPAKQLKDERAGNNDYKKQPAATKRPDYRGAKDLPDLVVTDVTADKTSVHTTFKNVGKGVTGADFIIQTASGGKSFNGNTNYRNVVPPPGTEVKVSVGLGMLGLKSGATAEVTAVVDPEERVRETDRKNNTLTKKITVP